MEEISKNIHNVVLSFVDEFKILEAFDSDLDDVGVDVCRSRPFHDSI